MKDKTDMITMLTDSGESVDFYVLEETRINAVNYLLVTDAPEDQDGECYILKDVSGQQDAEAVYEFVEDDRELDGLHRERALPRNRAHALRSRLPRKLRHPAGARDRREAVAEKAPRHQDLPNRLHRQSSRQQTAAGRHQLKHPRQD